MLKVKPAHCAHIADYYDTLWKSHMCIAWNLLRRGYKQWSKGFVEAGFNNLYALPESSGQKDA